MTRENPYIVSCDWYAIACQYDGQLSVNVDERTVYEDKRSAYTFTLHSTQERHPMYECAALAKNGNAPIAHLFYKCKRKDNPLSCQLKVDNSRLYYANWAEALLALTRALGWTMIRVVRIDVCCDFNNLANGRSPHWFCNDYLKVPTKNRPSFIRHSSNKVRVVAVRKLHSVVYETLSWGTRDSAVQVNLYNKSLELQVKADKPWIRQRWIENGLVHDPKGELTGKPQFVWRLEFSLNPSAVCLQAVHAHDVTEFNLNHVATPAALFETFHTLLPAYFTFHFLTRDAYKNPKCKVSSLPVVELFHREDNILYKPIGVRYYHKSTRTDRLLLKRLMETIDSDALNTDEKAAFAIVTNKLIETYLANMAKVDETKLSDDVITDYLKDCFRELVPRDSQHSVAQAKNLDRRAKRWVRMLRSSHDPDLQAYQEAMIRLTELEDTDSFRQMLAYSQAISWAPMSDCTDVMNSYLDEKLEEDILIDSLTQETAQTQSA